MTLKFIRCVAGGTGSAAHAEGRPGCDAGRRRLHQRPEAAGGRGGGLRDRSSLLPGQARRRLRPVPRRAVTRRNRVRQQLW